MKNVLIVLLIAFIGFNGFAQDNEFDKMMRQLYQDEFVDVVNENMNLSDADNALFQPIFSEFVAELGDVMSNKLKTQGKFSKYFESMTDEQVTNILSEVFANRKAYDKLLQKYEKKVAKEIGYQSAFRFFLIVEKVKSNFDYSMIQALPLINN